jgi:hypothetical protein
VKTAKKSGFRPNHKIFKGKIYEKKLYRKTGFLYFPRFARNRYSSIKKQVEKKPEIRILFSLILVHLHFDFDDFEIDNFEEIHDEQLFLRKLVKYFKNSTVRNSILQKHVIEDFNKDLKLILDGETRWNSLVERLLKLKNCIRKDLIDIGAENIYYN